RVHGGTECRARCRFTRCEFVSAGRTKTCRTNLAACVADRSGGASQQGCAASAARDVRRGDRGVRCGAESRSGECAGSGGSNAGGESEGNGGERSEMRLRAVVLAVGALAGAVLAQAQAVNCTGKLSVSKVETLLSGGVAQSRAEQIVRSCG